jgi:hypothetical protein
MTILKTKADVDNLSELRRRKAELKVKMDAEQAEIKEVWQEVRSDLQPGEIIGQAIKSMLGMSKKTETPADQAALGWASRLKGPLSLVSSLFVRDPKVALLLKVVTPLTVAYLPGLARKAKEITPDKKDLIGALRKGVSGLRRRLKKKNDIHLFI